MKKKFVLEFDEAPALLFISHAGGKQEELYIHGEKLRAWRGVTIKSSLNELTSYELDSYITKWKNR